MTKDEKSKPVVIKKYANRRLYDTETSAYITLEDLCDRVKEGRDFVVVDAKTGQDLTRQVLTQIIFEQETKGSNVLPTDFLRSVIGFYDNGMQNALQHYLSASMKSFTGNQDKIRSMMGKAMETSPMAQFEEITRQNVAFFEKTMSMFTPFSTMFTGADETDDKSKPKK